MATIDTLKNKTGEIKGYKFRLCLGRDLNNKQIWKSHTISRPENLTPAKERKEVQRLCNEWEKQERTEFERTGKKDDKNKITLEEFINSHWWKDHVMDGTHKPSSIAFYKNISTDIVEYFNVHERKLSQIDIEAVKRYINYLRNTAKTKSGKNLSAATVQHHFNVLRVILEYARRLHYIPFDPCQDLTAKEKPQKEQKEIDFLKPEDARRFIKCLDEEPLYWKTLLTVMITTGLRRGEICGLQWGDINKDKLTLAVKRNVTIDTSAPEKYHIGTPKSGKERIVPISNDLYALLTAFKADQEQRYEVSFLDTAYIFCREDNGYKPLYPSTPTAWTAKFIERHNLPDVSPHDLRHTAATLAHEAGADMKEIQLMLGHSDIATTSAFYTGVTEEAQRRTVEGIEKLLKQA